MRGRRSWTGVGAALALAGACELRAAAEATNGASYLVEFKNGDRLRARPEAADAGADRLTLAADAARVPLDVRLSSVSRFSRELGRDDGSASPFRVHLTNGDQLPLTQPPRLDGDTLVCVTPYAGELKVRRAMVRLIEFGPAGAVRQGVPVPLDLARWAAPGRSDRGDQSWSLEEGALTTRSSTPIGTDITNMPDAAVIQFTVRSDSEPMSLAVEVGGMAALAQSKGRYMLGVGSGRIYLRRTDADGRSASVGGDVAIPRGLRGRPSLSFDLCIDRVTGRVLVCVDGLLVGRWTDDAPTGNTGNGLVFRPQGGGRLILSQIRVGPWDGAIAARPDDFGAAAISRIALADGDVVSGSVESLGAGGVSVKGAYSSVRAPLADVRWLRFGSTGSGTARRNENDVRVRTSGGGQITLDLARLESGRMLGTSENVGAISVALDDVQAAEFDIYRTPPPASSATPDAGDVRIREYME